MLTKSFVLFLKLKGYRVDAETLTRRRWAVIKDVSKVSTTLFAGYLSSMHSKAIIHFSSMLSLDSGAQKLGQPVPESNFVSELKSSFPHTAHT